MKILTAGQISELDRVTIENEPIASIDLMERASMSFTAAFMELYQKNAPVLVFCGMGNNGGDGLAIARLLRTQGYSVFVYILKLQENGSEDFNTNYQRLASLESVVMINLVEEKHHVVFPPKGVIIDALWGTGLSRPIEGFAISVIDDINRSGLPVVAVDLPSGLMMDEPTEGTTVHADVTISFQVPKLAFMFADNAEAVGAWKTVDIGLSRELYLELDTLNFYTTFHFTRTLLKPRKKFGHKGNYGHALIIAGSYGKIGAAVLAARACLKAGAGLLTVQVPKCGYEIMQTAVPEAMVVTDDHSEIISRMHFDQAFNAIGVGPGIGQDPATQKALFELFQLPIKNLVLDADAINILAENDYWKNKLPPNTILTPHPGEFERLAGISSSGFERHEKQVNFSEKYDSYVVLKGAHTAISFPDKSCHFNASGTPGLATAGSGDVLTGIITGLCARGYPPNESTRTGVFLHGLAGELASTKQGMEAMTAMDIIDELGEAFKLLYNEK